MTAPAEQAEPGPVVEMRDCGWCGCKRPIDHLCPNGDPIPCSELTDDGDLCGICTACVTAQRQTYTRWGTPGDLHDHNDWSTP